MKEREWKPEVLAAKLRKQDAWERTKRAIVLDSVRTALLEKKMGNGRKGGGGGAAGDGSGRCDGGCAAAAAAVAPPLAASPARSHSGSSARDP